MTKKELVKFERRLVWMCFEERIPELLRDIDDSIAEGIIFSGGEHEGDEIWFLERDHCAIVIESNANGILKMTLNEPCHKLVSFNVIDKNYINDIDGNEVINLISFFCKIFVVGNFHILLDHICGAEDWRIALKAYLEFERANPDILNQVTYF